MRTHNGPQSQTTLRRHELLGTTIAGMLIAGALFASGVAQASPIEFLKGKVGTLQSLLSKTTVEGTAGHERKRLALRKLLRSMIDYGDLSKRSLWKHWEGRSPTERKDFVALLKQLIEDRVLSNINDNTDFTVVYAEPEVDGSAASVKTTVTVPGKPEIDVEYKMTKRGSKWRVWDVITDGTSLVRNYRSQFNKIILRDGYPALLDKMKDKLGKNESSGKVATAPHAG